VTDTEQRLTTRDPMRLAVRDGAGRWVRLDAVLDYVDGRCQAIEMPGFDTYADEGGVTATFHVAGDDGVARWVMRNGILESVERIGSAAVVNRA
jgi:hypothetical protein